MTVFAEFQATVLLTAFPWNTSRRPSRDRLGSIPRTGCGPVGDCHCSTLKVGDIVNEGPEVVVATSALAVPGELTVTRRVRMPSGITLTPPEVTNVGWRKLLLGLVLTPDHWSAPTTSI